MSPPSLALAILSVFLTSAAQLLLKGGIIYPLRVLPGEAPRAISSMLMTSSAVAAGLACFCLSVLVWMFVLWRLDVSKAYPSIALGIALTSFDDGTSLTRQSSR